MHIIQYDNNMTDEIPIWAKDFTPRQNAPKQETPSKYPCSHCGYAGPVDVDLTDLDALRSLTKRRLVEMIQSLPLSAKSLVAACNALLDRIDGKAPQAIQLDATVRQITVNAAVRFIDCTNNGHTEKPVLTVDNS